jgi:hypothetical protein
LQGREVHLYAALGNAHTFLGVQKALRGRGAKQHFCGDAASVKAGAAPMAVLDQRNFFASLSQNAGRSGSTRAASYYDDVICLHEIILLFCDVSFEQKLA